MRRCHRCLFGSSFLTLLVVGVPLFTLCLRAVVAAAVPRAKNPLGAAFVLFRQTETQWDTKNTKASPADQWLAQLADDGERAAQAVPEPNQTKRDAERQQQSDQTHTNEMRWMEAAKNIVEHSRAWHTNDEVALPVTTRPPLPSDPLRTRRNPSVADLLQKRALQMSEPKEGKWGFDYASGATFALLLYQWEPKGPQTLPTLQEVMRRCLAFQNKQPRGEGYSEQYQMGGRIARLTLARVRLGDDSAATEYGDWLRTVSPRYLGFDSFNALLALWHEQDFPALNRVAEQIFSETPPLPNRLPTAWSRLLSMPRDRNNYFVDSLFGSDLVRVEPFRRLLMHRLTDKTPIGIVVQKGDDTENVRFYGNDAVPPPAPLKNEEAQTQTVRICDRTAYTLRYLAGVPPFNPLASPSERSKVCAAIAAYLQKWGTLLGRLPSEFPPRPLYAYDTGYQFDYLGPTFFAQLSASHRATNADVRENRAIFSLKGTVRVAADLPAPLPLQAHWINDASPNKVLPLDGQNRWKPYSIGFIWQAEDAWEHGHWVRYYGYVGPHSIGKVPATQIQIIDHRVIFERTPLTK